METYFEVAIGPMASLIAYRCTEGVGYHTPLVVTRPAGQKVVVSFNELMVIVGDLEFDRDPCNWLDIQEEIVKLLRGARAWNIRLYY